MSKRKDNGTTPKSYSALVMWYGIPCAIIIFVLYAIWPPNYKETGKTNSITRPEASEASQPQLHYGPAEEELANRLENRLFLEDDPDLPGNKFMPPGLSTRLRWVKNRNQKGILDLINAKQFADPDGTPHPADSFMTAYFKNGKYSIAVMGPKVYSDYIASFGGVIPKILPLEFKITFAASMGHEVIHLENKKIYNGRIKHLSGEARLAEELRDWTATGKEIVGPLRTGPRLDVRQAVIPDFADYDDLSKFCGYTLPCPGLEKKLREVLGL